MPETQDAIRMREALALARLSEGLTRPNPPVGAVVDRNGRCVGRGRHRRAGGPHAEVYALRQAGEGARGATLYVTLEPCSTHGRTPPCTDAILAAGCRRVVVGARDPNPRHAGRGLRILRAGGVETVLLRDPEAEDLIRPFAVHMRERRPWVVFKWAMTADGRLADARGRSKWITGAPARERVQALRRQADVILVGAETVRRDNPSLLPRPSRGRKPWRVIVTASGRLPPTARVFVDEAREQTRIALPRRAMNRLPASLRDRALPLPAGRGGVRLGALMRELAGMGALRVLCEGGGRLAAGLQRADLIDEWVCFVAPCLLGGDGVPVLAGQGFPLASAPRRRWTDVERIGDDLMLRAGR